MEAQMKLRKSQKTEWLYSVLPTTILQLN